MKKRSPIFVAAFPFGMIALSYVVLIITAAIGGTPANAESESPFTTVFSIIGLVMILIGAFYTVYWAVVTKMEMVRAYGVKVPTALLLAVPFVNIWWYWRYSVAVDKVTREKLSAPLCFILLILLGCIGEAIIQDFFNKIEPVHHDSQPHHIAT
jgi:hypothetical protein